MQDSQNTAPQALQSYGFLATLEHMGQSKLSLLRLTNLSLS